MSVKKDRHKTKVCFRLLEGEPIALFPFEPTGTGIYINSYRHVGQHGNALPGLIYDLDPVTQAKEIMNLVSELKSIGYDLVILTPLCTKPKRV